MASTQRSAPSRPTAWASIPPPAVPNTPSSVVTGTPSECRPGVTSRATTPTASPSRRSWKTSIAPDVSGRGEPDAPGLRLGDLHVRELVGGDDDPATLVVDQGEDAAASRERLGDRLLHLGGAERALQHQLARGELHADLDLHRGASFMLPGAVRRP